MTLPNYEKLGVFYLGREYDLEKDAPKSDVVLYESKDLTTHAVCVGMTGSGKTGLCLSLLEEAAIDSIPVIAIDPKGDLGNLLLTFPELSAEQFAPWVDEGEAQRNGKTVEQYAKSTAEKWRSGLAEWDQQPERIAKFRDAVDLAIYTPGSDAGLPVSVIQSFAAPNQKVLNDSDAFRDRVMSAVSSLLALLKIDADPISSREHILLSNILTSAWTQGRSLTIPDILREIQQPPFNKVGFMDLDTFFPEKDRFSFAIQVNNLLASPGFASWMKGEPLNIERMLMTRAGKPRISIMSIAHLSDSERMFFVTILLNELLSWVRSQPGTTSLRAILYMDEVFGYFPPTANPPSKLPMLTLLKQARAFGVGVVLATQNPVDLDYKGLSNTGTWFLGRLQTERDKARVLDGLESVASSTGTSFNRSEMSNILSGLGSRKFLLHNVHENHPVVFQTRWALSYLRGPLTRQQIAELMKDRKAALATQSPSKSSPRADAASVSAPAFEQPATATLAPAISDSICQRYLAIVRPLPNNARLVYYPGLLGMAKVHYVDSKSEVDLWKEAALVIEEYAENVIDIWETCEIHWSPDLSFESSAESNAGFAELSSDLTKYNNYRSWRKHLRDYIYRDVSLPLWREPESSLYSTPEESESGFRMRVAQEIREQNDLDVEKLKAKYKSKFETARDRVLRAEERVKREEAQFKEQSYSSFISIGSSILGALMGRKVLSKTNVSKGATAMRSAGRAAREKGDIAVAQEKLKVEQEKLHSLEKEFDKEVETLEQRVDPAQLPVERYPVRPRKSDINVADVALLWMPFAVSADGRREALFEIAES
ncbi:ATP-binding protein [Rubinisphaera margarita]|uniref:ATP-binding protein n=1 Tax=Rubinisphaera margarita TaxID=2909586 RepID=UPI001EE8D375|nr:DUF87 domain-containing protein [Rubinisphaera margarita]MCG6158442.1 DUF87 domain-containing protein [Rubinisphaera margarita]